MAEKILEVQNLKKTFLSGKKSFTAVEDVSFFLNAGEVLGIVGESGDGYYRWKDFFPGKRYHTCEGKSSPGNLPGTSDGISDTGRIL